MKKILLLDASCVIGEYNTIKEAAADTLVDESDIKIALHEGLKTSSGYFMKAFTTHEAKPVIQLALDGITVIEVYGSVYEAKKKTGIMNITNCAKGRAKSAGGFIWQFVNEENIL